MATNLRPTALPKGIGYWYPGFDKGIVFATTSLILLGLVMVLSASIVIADQKLGKPLYFFWHHAVYLGLGFIAAAITFKIPIKIWQQFSILGLLSSILCLSLILIPGIGREVNGSVRWLSLGGLTLQVSELAKLGFILYLASYLVRHNEEVRTKISGFIKPLILIGMITGLLILEPDFGATVVIGTTAMGMMFLAGVRLRQFLVLSLVIAAAFAALAISSPYRVARLTSFLNPWADQFDSGYQLTQALIAFGRGEWFGVGLGNSIQKLFYLPEAHTDFLFAVTAEELGLFGVLCVLGLFLLFVIKAFFIAKRAQQQQQYFAAMLGYGITLWIGVQALINIGVNAGMLPTKGLTLPFMSYGGSSMIVIIVAVAILLRIDHETRLQLKSYKSWSKG